MKTQDFANIALAAAIAGMDGELIQRDMGNQNEPGRIYFANDARFVESNFSEPLTTYAVGWRDPENIEDTLNFVAPKVPVSPRFEYMKFTNAEEFLSETVEDIREIGADFKRVEYTSTKVTDRTYNRGLTIRIDEDSVRDIPNWRELYTGRLMRRLLRNSLRRAITLLSAAATNTAKTWDESAGKRPDLDVRGELITAQDAGGIAPNRVLYGQTAWQKRLISLGSQNTAQGFMSYPFDEAGLANWLAVDRVKMSKERYQSSASAKTQIVSNLVICFNAADGQTQEDPSNIKRFVSPTDGGTPFRVYEQRVNAKLIDISCEHWELVKITSSLGVRQLTVS